MAGEATLPNADDLLGMKRIVVPLIEEDMAEPGTDDGADHDVSKEYAHPTFGGTLMAEHATHYIIAAQEA